jgi:hypothetical protein
MVTSEQIEKIQTSGFDESSWNPIIKLFWDRYNKRYFDQIEILQKHSNNNIRNNCGFLIATVDCILIETLDQFYTGTDETKGTKNHDPFLSFFKRSDDFKNVIKEEADAGKFAGLIRSGLMHQSKTKKASIINKKSSTPILEWIDEKDKNKGFKLNRDKFHACVLSEFQILIESLKLPKNEELRKNFKDKILTIIE